MNSGNADRSQPTQDALRRIAESLLPQLPKIVAKYMGDQVLGFEEPNDIAQRVAIEMWNALPNFRQRTDDLEGDFRAWLATTVERRVIDAARRARKAMDLIEKAILDAARLEGASPDRRVAKDQAIRFLMDCVRKLDPAERRILALRFDHGKSFEDIGAELGVPEYSVRRSLERALVQLRDLMGSSSNYSFSSSSSRPQ